MSEERNYTLYKITAPDSEKFYIGVTGKTVEKRLASHLNDARCSKKKHKFFHWLRKRMTTATITPMLVRLTKEVALELERITVDLCFEHESEFILNTAPGGGMPPSPKGRKLSAAHCAKISARKKGQKHTDEARSKMSASQMGRKVSSETTAKRLATRAGYRHSEETRAKMSAAQKGRPACPSTTAAIVAAVSKPVIGISEDGIIVELPSAAEAARWVGRSRASFKSAIYRGGRSGGYLWSYK